MQFRQATLEDESQILALNTASIWATGPMDSERYRTLFGWSTYFNVAEDNGKLIGFLLGFENGSAYDSPNYQWFSKRLHEFMYVDRIVIDESQRGKGIGQQFYTHLFDTAAARKRYWVAAEINAEPPNPVSMKFHQKNGFQEVGIQHAGEEKILSMQIRPVV